MANDSTNAGVSSSVEDTTPHNEIYFTDMQGEDAFFGPEQLAQATEKVVPVPQGQNVIRVQVNPGEIIELSSPFDPGATLLAREGDGNLAIRVGDVTVILQGYVDANQQAPVVLHSSDGQPIDIATLLASTDPTIDIQTAAGPGDTGAQGQGADNTGALLSQFANGNGLGGLNAVGAQDATQLNYGLIDNSIRLDREDALLSATTLGFKGLSEPFLRDPFNNDSFSDFATFFSNYKTDVNGTGDAWADFTGTAANGTSFESYLEQTSFTIVVAHTSEISEPLYIDTGKLAAQLASMKSNQHGLHIDPATVNMDGTATTVFVRRDGDDALILVIHAHAAGEELKDDSTYSNGDFQIDTYLINRLDHPGQGQDILNLDVPFKIREFDGEESQEPVFTEGTVNVPIQDDIPIVQDTTYYNFLHASSYTDAMACFLAFCGGKITDYTISSDAGHVDEDYIFHGNKDKDNAFGPDSDSDRGDDIGDKFVAGFLNLNWGADGPSGKIPEGDKPWGSSTDPYFTNANPPALAIKGLEAGSDFPGVKSQGHDLIVLKHQQLGPIEILEVGYKLDGGPTFAKTGNEVVVFTLLLQTGANFELFGANTFGGFIFAQCAPIDHPVGATLETNLLLNFEIEATDDDGDHPVDPVFINIMVNDDAPYFSITYTNEDPKNCERDDVRSLDGGYGHVDHYTTKDFGHVDEDWLQGGRLAVAVVSPGNQGNHDQDGLGDDNANLHGDDKGGLQVCGQIKVKFGADGPSDAENNGDLGLKTYDTSDPENLPLFVNGGEPATLTSGGHPLVVLKSTDGHLVVGYVTTYTEGVDGVSPSYTTEHRIFELCLNPDTGKFEFNLLGPIDHLPSTVDEQPESNLVLSFDVGFAEDFDHDQALGAIKIKVNDDKPEIGITYYNNLEHDFGVKDDKPFAALSGGDGNATTDYGHVDEDFLKTGSQVSGLHYYGNQDLDANQLSNANQHGDDIGKTEVCGDITIHYGGDGGASHTIGLDVYTPPTLPDTTGMTKEELVDAILAYNATIPVFKNVDGSTVTKDGVELQILESDSGHLQVGTPPYFTIIDNILTLVPGTIVFDITVDSNGHFDFKLWSEIDHDPQSGPDGVETNELLTFKAGSATDNDGDTTDAVIKIQVNDDSPEVRVEYVNNDGYKSTTVGIVDEDWIIKPGTDPVEYIGNADADSTPGDTDGKGTVFFDVFAGGFGGDGSGPTTGIGFTAEEGETFTAKDDNGNSFTLTTADGHEVLAHAEDNGVGGFTLIGYFNSDGSEGFVDGSSTEVFTLAYNSDAHPVPGGQFNLLQSLAHPLGNEDNLHLSFGILTGVTDGDGDPAVAWINIQVNDDGPQAVDDTFTPDTDEPDVDAVLFAVPADYSGNVLDNDKKGADDAKVTGASSTTGGPQSPDIDGDTTVAGALGLLILHANGQWEYTPTSGTAGGVDEFTYTITDGDGDTASAKLTITVPSDISTLAVVETGPTHSPADHYDRTVDPVTGLNGIVLDNKSTHFVDPTGGHVISGGGGNDYIEVTGDKAAPVVFGIGGLNGGGGDDIIQGGGGKDQIHGNAGDDTLYGGNNDDDLYGDAGHDAMDGGAGNDKIHVDADDLDGTNTLDGTHSIDGGDGYDTVDISGMKSFDSIQALSLENVEALAMDGKAAGGGGTIMSLTYDAAYGITQVGALSHALNITGDASGKGADTVHLMHGAGGESWSQIGSSNVYEAGVGAAKVTVTVEAGVHVDMA